ncbi:MAG: septum site-determining protein MinD [Clostridia bacterium]|nr:septum site-determining protein MinD [Clostridia bacterium]
MSKTILFASGKGGVGKSTVSATLAAALAAKGRRVVLVDADIGLRSQDLLLNLESRVVYDLIDVARGRCLLSQALLESPDIPGLFLLPAAQFARCRDLDPKKLKRILALLQGQANYVFIDCPAGLERGLRNVLNAGASEKLHVETVLVVTPDDLSVRGAERAASLIGKKDLSRPSLLVNRLNPDMIRSGDMYTAQTIASLLDLPLLGEIPEDPAVVTAQLRHRPVLAYECEARRAFLRIADRLEGGAPAFPSYGGGKPSFLRRLFSPKLREAPWMASAGAGKADSGSAPREDTKPTAPAGDSQSESDDEISP